MKNVFKGILLITGMLLLGACSGGGGENSTISINLNAGSLPDKSSVSIDQLRHVITLSGPSGKQTYNVSGRGTVKASVAAGLWIIDVEAFLGDELYAVGSASAEVKAGRNTSVTIFMTVVWGSQAAGGVGGGSGGGSSPTPYRITLDQNGTVSKTETYGYSTSPIINVTISNTGTQSTGSLDVNISDTTNFNLSTATIADIATGGTDTFNVWPNTGLPAGNYTTTVSVASATNGINASFNVSFTVGKANPVITTWPTGMTATVGATLGSVSIIGYSNVTPGTFSWPTPTTTLTGPTGAQAHGVTFTPTDTANYNTVNQNVTIVVSAIQRTINWYLNGGTLISAGQTSVDDGSKITTQATVSGPLVTSTLTEGLYKGTWPSSFEQYLLRWELSTNPGVPWDFNSDTVNANITLNAVWQDRVELSSGANIVAQAVSFVRESENKGIYTLLLNGDVPNVAPQPIMRYSELTLRGLIPSKISIASSPNGSLFEISGTVGTAAKLTLDNGITLEGKTNNTFPLVNVSGTLIMNTGSKITGNYHTLNNNSNYEGGGVYVNTSGNFTMNGGEIFDNQRTQPSYYGGGVYVNGTFNMNDGSIYNNSAFYGGGVYVRGTSANAANFTMSGTGPTIYSNTATASGGTGGGGVYVYSYGNFELQSGAVKANVYGNTGTDVINNGGTISGGDTTPDTGW